jgi:hypothetical protein
MNSGNSTNTRVASEPAGENAGAGVLSQIDCAIIALDDYSMGAKGQPSPTAQGLRKARATIESAMALPGKMRSDQPEERLSEQHKLGYRIAKREDAEALESILGPAADDDGAVAQAQQQTIPILRRRLDGLPLPPAPTPETPR